MKLRNQTLIRWLARAIVFVFRCLFMTLRCEVTPSVPGFTPLSEPDEVHRSLFCVWHDAILAEIFSGKSNHVAALVSQNFDGSIIAEILDAVGIQAIRGSSSRGGAAAIKQMFTVAERRHVFIATDGPRGPRRVVKDGIIYLASLSGRPIVPTSIVCSWAWKPRGRWTDMVIPMPFSRLTLLAGNPVHVPPGLTPQQLEPFRRQVQQAMESLEVLALRKLNGESVDLSSPQSESPTLNALSQSRSQQAA